MSGPPISINDEIKMCVSDKLKAIFFDFGDTLASTDPPFILRIAMSMREAGLDISDREFELKYVEADYKLYLKHKLRGGMTPEDYGRWFLPILYESLPIESDMEEFRHRVRDAMSRIEFTRVALPGALDLLDYLKGKGFKLGVISNNDGYTETKCEQVGIREHFDFILDSTRLDMIKPDPRIFQHALEKAELMAEEVIHVGDMYGSDVMGADDAGLDVIWVNSRNVDQLGGKEVKQVTKLSEIKSIL